MKSSGSSGSTEVDYSGFFNRISSYSAPDNYVSNPSYYDDYFSYNTSNSSSGTANPVHNTDDTEAMRQAEGGENGGGFDDRFSNSEKTALGLAATGGSVHVTTELIKRLSGTVNNADIVNFGKSVTKKFGLVEVGLTIYSVSSDGTLTAGDGARILLSGATFIPYVGWAYGAVDIGVLLVTGTSLTDRVGDFVDEHWDTDPIRLY